jgi:hypothetical protein
MKTKGAYKKFNQKASKVVKAFDKGFDHYDKTMDGSFR